MYFFVVAFGLLLHLAFWGAGLAALAMPSPWRRFWPVLVAPAAFALQSAVVWAGAYAGLRGTQTYAFWSELIPAALLALAAWKRGVPRLVADVRACAPPWLLAAACLSALMIPMAIGGKGVGLTTMSLGSCDAADYAAGARVLTEFARSDRDGFLGLTEVVGLMSVDNFFDFWLRLNHFTPSALLALNGPVLDCQPHELTGIMTAVLLASSLPIVFWLARAVLRYRSVPSAWIAVIYGLSPITWYAVFQVAMGQLIAAQAIAVMTWSAIALWRARLTWRRGLAMAGVLAIGYAVILGSYNFILIVCLVPAVAVVGGHALWRGEWRKFVRWCLLVIAPLGVAGLVFWDRVAGLTERFMLLRTFDFGWRIPFLGPAGWLGMVTEPNLNPLPAWLRLALSVLVVAALVHALVQGAKRGCTTVFTALCLAVPILIGYTYLNLRGLRLGTNASYDAYKLLSVFYPGVLAALCYWVAAPNGRSGAVSRWMAAVLSVLVTGFVVHGAYRFAKQMEKPPLIVGRQLIQLREIENRTRVTSLNMRIPDMWSRLWANAFLLRKPQYFSSYTYEGRRNTPLRGEWDLNGGLVMIKLPDGDSIRLNSQHSLVNTRSPYFVRQLLHQGFHGIERFVRGNERWRWTNGNAVIRLHAPHAHPLRIRCQFRVRSLDDRELQVWFNGTHVRNYRVGSAARGVSLPELILPPGGGDIELRTSIAPVRAPGDRRVLVFALYNFDIEVLGAATPAASSTQNASLRRE